MADTPLLCKSARVGIDNTRQLATLSCLNDSEKVADTSFLSENASEGIANTRHLETLRSDLLNVYAKVDTVEAEIQNKYGEESLERIVQKRIDKLLGRSEEEYLRSEEEALRSEFSQSFGVFHGNTELYNGGKALVWNKELARFESEDQVSEAAAKRSNLGLKKGFLGGDMIRTERKQPDLKGTTGSPASMASTSRFEGKKVMGLRPKSTGNSDLIKVCASVAIKDTLSRSEGDKGELLQPMVPNSSDLAEASAAIEEPLSDQEKTSMSERGIRPPILSSSTDQGSTAQATFMSTEATSHRDASTAKDSTYRDALTPSAVVLSPGIVVQASAITAVTELDEGDEDGCTVRNPGQTRIPVQMGPGGQPVVEPGFSPIRVLGSATHSDPFLSAATYTAVASEVSSVADGKATGELTATDLQPASQVSNGVKDGLNPSSSTNVNQGNDGTVGASSWAESGEDEAELSYGPHSPRSKEPVQMMFGSIATQITNNTKTWANIIGPSNGGKSKLRFIPPTVVNGKPVVHVASQQFEKYNAKFDKLVVGSFVGKRMDFHFVKDIVSKTWKIQKPFTMKTYGDKMFTFEFACEEDKRLVLEMGSFFIASQLFVIRPWKLFVEADVDDLKSIPIWVIVKKLPLEMWDDDGFSQVGSVVGVPLFVDRPTEDRNRTSFARICVEIDTNCNYPGDVTVVLDQKKAFKVMLEYNWKPPRCSTCQVFGHTDAKCSKRAKAHTGNVSLTWVQKENPIITENNRANESEQEKDPVLDSAHNPPLMETANSSVRHLSAQWEKPKKKNTFRAKPNNFNGNNANLATQKSKLNDTRLVLENNAVAFEKHKDKFGEACNGGGASYPRLSNTPKEGIPVSIDPGGAH